MRFLMKEMPQDRMMNRLLAENKVNERDIRALVRILVPFYRQARTGKGINPFGRIEIWAKNTEENFAETRPYVRPIDFRPSLLPVLSRGLGIF